MQAGEAKRRIVASFPGDFEDPTVEPFGEGLDNAAFLVDGAWVFRFPRDEARAWFLRRELAVLPRLPPLPVEVPVPRFVDPAPFAGYRLLPGTPASIAARVDLEGVAATLGACLRQLHDLRLDGVDGTPPRVGKTVRSLAMTRFPARYRALAESLEAPPPAEPRWIHGDLYPRHLLVDDAGALTGILDWGDVQLGDVALDLSVVLGWLPPPARPAFFDVYGPIDDATQVRARFLALYYGVVLADAAEQLGAPDLARLSAIYLGHATGDTE